MAGASWEGFVIETLLNLAPEGCRGWFYRTAAGAEIDLLLEWPDQRLWAIEACPMDLLARTFLAPPIAWQQLRGRPGDRIDPGDAQRLLLPIGDAHHRQPIAGE